jgi:hypothetical protein
MDNFTALIGPKTTTPTSQPTTTSLRQQPTLPLQDIHYNIALNGRPEGSKLLSSPAKQSDPVDRSFVDRQIADRPLGDRQTDECPLRAYRPPIDRFTAELPRPEPVRTQGSATEAEIRAMPPLHQTGSSIANPTETGYYTGCSPWPPSQSSEAAPCRTTSSSSASSLHAPCGSWSPSSPSVGTVDNKFFFLFNYYAIYPADFCWFFYPSLKRQGRKSDKT